MGPRRAGSTGVLVMAHGTPDTPEGIESFYTAIRRGRPPTPEQLSELVQRYEAIGGVSPLTERTRAQVDGLTAALDAAAPGRFIVRYGTKYATPSIEDGVAELSAAGATRVVGIVLTPHQSSLGTGQYLERAEAAAAAAPSPMTFTPVASWHRAPGFASILADRVTAQLDAFPRHVQDGCVVFFTAHSLPSRAVSNGDPYSRQVGESAADIATAAKLTQQWRVAWQSAGRTADPWIGPDLLEELRSIAASGASAALVCPVGFVSDHLEILFDLDVEAAGVARSVGLTFARTDSLNDDPRFLTVLAGVVQEAAAQTDGERTAATGSP